jgi:phosphoribosylglycinamide formyltransferase-1
MIRLGFLASNNGTSMRAIVGAIEAGELDAEARLVVSNRRQAAALDFAREHGVPAVCIPTLTDPDAADAALAEALLQASVELVVLSGYLRKLGPKTLAAFRNRVLNVHPARLPEFGGQGMYGRRVHEAVLAASVTQSGATVHIVDAEYDHGPVVAQSAVPIERGDTAESLERRVMAAEPVLFIDTLRRISEGSLRLPA